MKQLEDKHEATKVSAETIVKCVGPKIYTEEREKARLQRQHMMKQLEENLGWKVEFEQFAEIMENEEIKTAQKVVNMLEEELRKKKEELKKGEEKKMKEDKKRKLEEEEMKRREKEKKLEEEKKRMEVEEQKRRLQGKITVEKKKEEQEKAEMKKGEEEGKNNLKRIDDEELRIIFEEMILNVNLVHWLEPQINEYKLIKIDEDDDEDILDLRPNYMEIEE
ncbi:golgin subfamily A member 6-like protein 26 [Macrosteles quadrilineatus]|uniref:golgin subfamily A member 6-like protein 26 n=1 Tax=Macrosteles quadrilineatus TaxID=74068 RepID=UPI0023E1AE13|nr:golgin subfamily A member 6-like protein 26 [Macrosteles quadrilineatus]